DAQDELDALKDAQAKAEADRQREADEAKGDYEAAKAAIEQERDAAATERATLKAERDALLALVKADVDAQWDALPDEVKEAFDGNDDDVLARKQHMNRMAKVIARLTEKAHTPGNGPNPKPSDGDTKTNIREALKAIRYT